MLVAGEPDGGIAALSQFVDNIVPLIQAIVDLNWMVSTREVPFNVLDIARSIVG